MIEICGISIESIKDFVESVSANKATIKMSLTVKNQEELETLRKHFIEMFGKIWQEPVIVRFNIIIRNKESD